MDEEKEPPAPLRENPDDEDFDETNRKVSDQQGETAPASPGEDGSADD